MSQLKRAHAELFRRAPDECYDSLPALVAQCQRDREASQEHWHGRKTTSLQRGLVLFPLHACLPVPSPVIVEIVFMRIELTKYHEKCSCLWCKKDQAGVTATFDDGFLDGAICWRCLAQAARLRVTDQQKSPAKVYSPKQQNS